MSSSHYRTRNDRYKGIITHKPNAAYAFIINRKIGRGVDIKCPPELTAHEV